MKIRGGFSALIVGKALGFPVYLKTSLDLFVSDGRILRSGAKRVNLQLAEFCNSYHPKI